MNKASSLFLGLVFATLNAAASALPFNLALGDDVDTVKAKMGTDLAPEPMATASSLRPSTFPDPNKGKTVLHLRTKGTWIFFNQNGVAETIRLDAPFNGSLRGVRLGDSEQKLVNTLGKPIAKPQVWGAGVQLYRYVLDDSAYMTIHVGEDGVQTIFITR